MEGRGAGSGSSDSATTIRITFLIAGITHRCGNRVGAIVLKSVNCNCAVANPDKAGVTLLHFICDLGGGGRAGGGWGEQGGGGVAGCRGSELGWRTDKKMTRKWSKCCFWGWARETN